MLYAHQILKMVNGHFKGTTITCVFSRVSSIKINPRKLATDSLLKRERESSGENMERQIQIVKIRLVSS